MHSFRSWPPSDKGRVEEAWGWEGGGGQHAQNLAGQGSGFSSDSDGGTFEGLGPKSGMICLMFYKDQSGCCVENEL